MNIQSRLEKLERSVRQEAEAPRVYFADEDIDSGKMDIPALNFSGTSSEGRKLMEQYPNCTFIVDDIPKSPGVLTC